MAIKTHTRALLYFVICNPLNMGMQNLQSLVSLVFFTPLWHSLLKVKIQILA